MKQLHADALAKGWPAPLQLMATAATERGHATTVQYCLERGADIDSDVNTASKRGSSPDLYAVLMKAGRPTAPRTINDVLRSDLWKDEPVVRYLIDHGAQIGPGVLALAATGCDIATLNLLVARGCQIHDSGALQTAASNNMLANVKWLLHKGARINEIPKYNSGDERDFNNGTALHRAVAGIAVEVVRYLLEQGADTQIRDQQGRTAVQIAKQIGGKRMDEIIDLLDRATIKL